MRLRFSEAVVLLIALLFATPAPSQQPGKFDYYVLNMSWSPEYCYSHRSAAECSQHLGLIVHGLWPQYSNAGRGPENCTTNQPGPSNPNSYLDLIPTISLIQHEWSTHGTCSGLSGDNYFGLIRHIFSNFHAPAQLERPSRQIIIRIADLKQAIERSNSNLNDSEINFTCTGQYLREVELCTDKSGNPQPCSGLSQCRGTGLHIPPIR